MAQTDELHEPHVPPRFEDVCFGEFDDRGEYPTPAELKKVFGRVSGQPYQISETTKRLRTGERRISHLSGVFRLNHQWKPDTTLRLSLIDPGLLQLHFWRGRQGVTLRYCPPAVKTWGAYRTTRQGTRPQPSTFADWALDGGRYRRAGLGTFEVRYHDGNIVLTRGDLRLLSVPMEGLPAEVYLEGSGLVRGVTIYRSTGGPKRPELSPVVLSIPKPAEAAWQLDLPDGVTFEKATDGAVELSAGANTPAAQAGLPIPGPGLYEYIFELEDPDVGTGVFLGNRDGRQLARFAFYRDTTTGRTTFAYLGPQLEATELEFDFTRAMVPYAGEHQWVRLTLGGGVMKCWTSGDRVHWSQSIWSPLAVQGPVQQVGLYCIPTPRKRSIKLRSLEIRRLELLSSLAPPEIQRRVGPLADAATFQQWQRRVEESRPSDISPELWRRACIVRTLAENPYFSLGGAIIHGWLDEALSEGGVIRPEDLTRQLKLLEEAAVLIHCLDRQSARPFDRHYQRLGMRLLRSGHPDPLGVISAAVMRTPIWNHDRQNAWPEKLLRHQLLTLACEDRWPQVEELFGRLRYWTLPDRLEARQPVWGGELQYLVDWAEWQLARRREKEEERPAGERPAVPPPAWRHPLIERLSKEGYNVMAEFQAALDAVGGGCDGDPASTRAYRAACQIISTSADPDVLGLLPDVSDRRLLVSQSVAVASAMRDDPVLQQAMQESYGALGEIRLRLAQAGQAVAGGDVAAVEAVTLQFCGTTAAAKAHAWLGNRQMSAGRASRAAGHYRQALPNIPAEQRATLHARLRLAGAMRGRDVGQPVTTTVEIGEMRLSADEFEQMVRGLREANRGPDATVRNAGESTERLPQFTVSSSYDTKPWARLDGAGIERPLRMPGFLQNGPDWAARQIGVVVAGRRMIVNNQVDLVAFDVNTGQRLWLQRQQLQQQQSPWPAVRMNPVVVGERVFARRLTDAAAELICCDVSDGKIVWTLFNKKPSEYVASDPPPVGQDLFALTVSEDEGRKVSLQLAQLDPGSGRLRRETLLADFDDAWDGNFLRKTCRATEADGMIVVTTAGCVVCCDLSGRLRWIRRQIWIPAPSTYNPQANAWLACRHGPPLVADGRVYATQPGVWNVECLDLQTGRLIWRKAVPELIGLLGLLQQRLIMETADGLLAGDASSGETLWRHNVQNALEGRVCDPESGIVYGRLLPSDDPSKNPRWALVAIDPVGGRPMATSVLNTRRDEELLFGPLVINGARAWAFLAGSNQPATRQILELIPAEERK